MSANTGNHLKESPPSKTNDRHESFACGVDGCLQKVSCIEELGIHVRSHGLCLCPGCYRLDTKRKLEKHFFSKRHLTKQTFHYIEEKEVVIRIAYACSLCDFKNSEIRLIVDHYWSHAKVLTSGRTATRGNPSTSLSHLQPQTCPPVPDDATMKNKNKMTMMKSEEVVSGPDGHSNSRDIGRVLPPAHSPTEEFNLKSQHVPISNDQSNHVVLGASTCGVQNSKLNFSSIGEFRNHRTKRRGVQNHVCPICACEFIRKFRLEKHFRLHTKKTIFSRLRAPNVEEKVIKYMCPLCDFLCRGMTTMMKHYKTFHVNSKTKEESEQDRIEYSGNASESYEGSVVCSSEPSIKTEGNAENMEFEFVAVSNSVDVSDGAPDRSTDPLEGPSDGGSWEKEFLCRYCGFESDNERSMEIHMRIHISAVNGFTCGICDFESVDACHMTQHASWRHIAWRYTWTGEKSYLNKISCPLCGLKRHSEKTMRHHMAKAHSVLTPNRTSYLPNNVCPTCSREFGDPEAFASHLSAGFYVCEACNFKSSSKCDLDVHKKSHNFPCDMCDFIGTSVASLILHKRYHHSKTIIHSR